MKKAIKFIFSKKFIDGFALSVMFLVTMALVLWIFRGVFLILYEAWKVNSLGTALCVVSVFSFFWVWFRVETEKL